MKDFTTLRRAQKVLWNPQDCEFAKPYEATVVRVSYDHSLAVTEDGMELWIDNDTIGEFVF